MENYDSILSAARQLPEPQRIQLIEALWDSVPDQAEAPFSEEWIREIERRMDELEQGKDESKPWSQVRDEALTRINAK